MGVLFCHTTLHVLECAYNCSRVLMGTLFVLGLGLWYAIVRVIMAGILYQSLKLFSLDGASIKRKKRPIRVSKSPIHGQRRQTRPTKQIGSSNHSFYITNSISVIAAVTTSELCHAMSWIEQQRVVGLEIVISLISWLKLKQKFSILDSSIFTRVVRDIQLYVLKY